GSPAPMAIRVDRAGERSTLLSVPAPPSQVDLAILEIVGVGLEWRIVLVHGEADTELRPPEERRAAAGAEVAPVLARDTGVSFHHERDTARPDRIEGAQDRSRLVVRLDRPRRDLVERPDEHNVGLMLVDQVMHGGQVALSRD